ncbi:MAG: GNAT family N-acetyltransferase [Moritella sp.]|uniref:GNAT family N-acetyltransferase n=1 Tax=Moritella sp. TaxID=78556 RepID=UPI00216E59C0|nr:GNAT family N-acetyltransferase [Moritella sp.]MBL1418221.1 GNAT family N-acetyltransferase [Moritella sp.]
MKIRVATVKDSSRIADIHATSWRSSYAGILSNKYLLETVPQERLITWKQSLEYPKHNQCIFVAEYDDKVIGFICVLLDEDPLLGSYIDNLHIDTSHQSRGIGRALLAKAAEWCNELSPKSGLFLLVTQQNKRAQAFYTRLGGYKQQTDSWVAPEGTIIPTYRFVWQSMVDVVVLLHPRAY